MGNVYLSKEKTTKSKHRRGNLHKDIQFCEIF